jgi:hypothetical protein
LRESQLMEDGSVVQVYIRRRDDERWVQDGLPIKAMDGVIEVIWIPK